MRGGRGAILKLAVVAAAGASLAACASVHPEYATSLSPHAPRVVPGGGGYKIGAPYQVGGVWYVPREQPDYDKVGVASWYGDQFNLKATANGEIFDKNIPSAAHPTLPLPSLVEVTNLDNGRKLVVRVNDRGPYVGGRIIDLSEAAAHELGYERAGLAHVRVRYIGPAPLYGQDSLRYAKAEPSPQMKLAARAPRPAPVTSSAGSFTRREAPHVLGQAVGKVAEVVLTSAPAPAAPSMIVESRLAPLTGKALPDLMPHAEAAPSAAPQTPVAEQVALASPKSQIPSPQMAQAPARSAADAARLAQSAPAAVASDFKIQVGAFADPDNADRAVAMLARTGRASIVPMTRNGTTLYRVVLEAANEDEAEALRQRVAQAGFGDAQVIQPF
ncbi:MAG: septal ring lytic transglycosylase RlpA family protein [Alphaproteobacteria bacterium]|nr:septal ring lytic transglycosylase RlpA family protein [Alphaproteobacteria bacterium]